MNKLINFLAIASLGSMSLATAATIVYDDVLLSSGNPVSNGGVTLTSGTSGGGDINFITGGEYTGLWFGGTNGSGGYTISFSQFITSIEIEFDALSSTGGGPVETISAFATNNGSVTITYLNQFGTTFDGSTITSTDGDGQGIISFSGPAFNSFSFNHNQGGQNGFVIERVTIETGSGGEVPEPATIALLGAGLGGIILARKRRESRIQ